jgi:PAS domain S-box-containing protein
MSEELWRTQVTHVPERIWGRGITPVASTRPGKSAGRRLFGPACHRRDDLDVIERQRRALVNAPIEAAILLDTSGIILALNEIAAQRLGKSADELVGLCAYDVFPPALAKSRKAQVDRALRSGAPVRFEDKREGRFFDHSLYPVFDAQKKVTQIAVFVHDVTHRKQAEERIRTYQERIRSLASQLSLAEERERRRIATTLHDRIGQTLAICKIKLGMLQESASSTGLTEPLDEIRELIEQIIRDTRSLTFELSSPILYELGLEPALEWLAEQIQEQYGLLSHFEDDRQPKPLDDGVSVLLFQAARELLTNVAKHAQAHNVKVSLRRDDSNIRITVEDDGNGFDTSDIVSHWSRSEGFGLFSLHERLDQLGGQLKVKSKPGHGTRVTLVAPLKCDRTTRDERNEDKGSPIHRQYSHSLTR